MRLRAKQSAEVPPHSNRWQILCWGELLVPGNDQPGFADESQMREAWTAHRSAIMASYDQPGQRPAAFYTFDLGMYPPRDWPEELDVLMTRQLIDPAEAARVEALRPILSPMQEPALCESFGDADKIRAMQLDRTLPHYAQEFQAAARWHEWRGRAQLADKYARLSAAVESVLEERKGENPMTEDDPVQDDQDRELNELVRSERARIRTETEADPRRVPRPAPFIEIAKRRPGWIAALKRLIQGKPGRKRRPGQREKAVIENYEIRKGE